jgi:hypothetical protein
LRWEGRHVRRRFGGHRAGERDGACLAALHLAHDADSLAQEVDVVGGAAHDLALAHPEAGAEHGDDPVPLGQLVVDDLHPACCPPDDLAPLGPRTAYGGGAARVLADQLIVDGRGEQGRQNREDDLRRRVGQLEPA